MASASEDDSGGDLFLGFDEGNREAVAAVRQARFEARQDSDSESDISDISDVSSVATADLSNFTDSKEEEETWNVDENPIRVLPFTEPTGSTSGVAEDGTAIDFFYLMFPEDLIEHIVTETNRYARECTAAKPDPERFDTMLEEIKAFLGLHVLFGIKQLPAIRLYWSNDPLIGVLAVQKVMSRNRFDKLSKYFHLNNNAN
ncbi:piggyBac transposable element-derived protein 4-like [Acropora muricata]|uniref:piggyBac transposable element-derived protein 4-like n=1 Tax=Acropora muricata TaxID=159855 RepID=UPI0034E44885